jgi:hypothetical protein
MCGSPGAAATVFEIAGRLLEQGGAALLIDYGYDSPRDGSTLQAVREHRAELAMLPCENSLAGRVPDIHRLLPDSSLHVVGEPPDAAQRAEMLDAAGVTDPAERARLAAGLQAAVPSDRTS